MQSPKYTYDQAYEASLEYFKGDELAARVWASKYALKDSFGTLYERTPDDMHRRIAGEIARIESKYPNPMRYMPSSRISATSCRREAPWPASATTIRWARSPTAS